MAKPIHALHPDSTGIETHCGFAWDLDTRWASYKAPEVTCPDCLVAQAARESGAATRLDVCRCYVRDLPREHQLQLRWGAHALDCPTYCPSQDPVDNAKDNEVRRVLTERKTGVHA